MDKYQQLRDAETNGDNYELSTEDIIEKLQQWDTQYGIELSDIEFDAVNVTFQKLPDDLTNLALEIYEFCPDTIEQHFGCMADFLESFEESGQDVPEDFREFIKDVDLTDDNYGLELLKRSLALNKLVSLWWD
jgi:hypothetical protein